MKRSFLVGLALAAGALAALMGTAASAEQPVRQPSMNEVVTDGTVDPLGGPNVKSL